MCLIVQNSLACILRNEVCSLVLRALDDTHFYMRHSLMYFNNSAKVLFNFKVLDPITFYTPYWLHYVMIYHHIFKSMIISSYWISIWKYITNQMNIYGKIKTMQINYKIHTHYLLSEADSLTQNWFIVHVDYPFYLKHARD